jgi:integrase
MKKLSQWSATSTQFVYRHNRSGRYYVRAYHQGREVWKSLGTTNYSIAKAAARDRLAEIHKAKAISESMLDGKPTVGQAAELFRAIVQSDVSIKPSSKLYREQTVKTLFRTWPGLAETRLSAVTETMCRDWAQSFLQSKRAAGPGWKSEAKQTISPSRFNNTVDSLRKIFEVGIKNGVILSNPANAIGKVTPRQKPMRIPSRQQFTALVAEIRGAEGAVSQCSGDLVQFLAFSGCRLDESRWIKWSDIDSTRKQLFISGHPEHSTKNSQGRWIPIIGPLETLLADMRTLPRYPRSADRRKGDFILAVKECQKAIDRACARLNIPRFSHHDLRHLFATRCIESGCDVPTLSRWLGHKDGGQLCMKTYGHLQNEHSQRMAERVTF